MDQDQPRADVSATIDPATIAGSQTQPYSSDSSVSSDSPTNSLVSNTNNNPPVSNSTLSYGPIAPSTDSLDSPSTVVSAGNQTSPLTSTNPVTTPGSIAMPGHTSAATVSQSKPTIRDKAFKFNKTAVIATVAALSVIVAVGIGSLVLTSSNGNNVSISGNNKPITTTYKPQSLSVGNITGYNQLLTGKNQNLKVNGQLSVSNSIVLSPTTTPTSPTLGQLYYNSSTNTPYLYNGKSFISLIPSVGGTIAGASTSLSLGNGLGLQGSNLVSTGVTSLSGTPGQIIASASNGSIKLSLPSNLTIAGNFTTTNGLVTNNLEADYITGNGYGITDINPNALPSTLAYQNKNNTFTAPQKFKNSTNSTDSFSIQDAAGNTLLSADTTDNTLTVSNLLPEDPGVSVQGVTQNSIIADSGNDGYNDNGQWSVMGSDGFMRFVYTNWTTDTIHYVRCENTSCTTYIDQPIETDATNGLDSPTIALDKNGDAYIAYIDYTSPTNSWHIAHCSDENCSTTTIEDLTQTNPYGYNGSIAVDGQDHADLVYDTYDYSVSPQLYSLEFIHCDNTDCSLNTDTTLASSNSNNGGSGYETSSVVTAPDGYPRVAYVNEGTDSLVYDNCSGSYDCSSYTSNVVDNGNASYWMAMAVGSDGLAKFVYEGSGNPNNDALEYAACSDAACSTASKTQLVSGTNSDGGYGSIALTSNNLPVISSYTKPNGQAADLLYIYCSDADCTSPTTKTVASLGTEGYTSNIGITSNGLPMITYIYQDSGSDASIDSVTLGDITGASITSGTDIGSSSDPFGTIYANSIQTSNVNSGSDGQLLVQGSADASNAFTVQDASGNSLLNVDSLTGTTSVSSYTPDQLSANLITDSNYNDGSWTGTDWSFSGDSATYNGNSVNNGPLSTTQFNAVPGDTYQVTFTVTGDSNNNDCIAPELGGSGVSGPVCGGGTTTDTYTASNASGLSFLDYWGSETFSGTVSNVSIQQFINHPVLEVNSSNISNDTNTVLSVDSAGDLTASGDVSGNTLTLQGENIGIASESSNPITNTNFADSSAWTANGDDRSNGVVSGNYSYVIDQDGQQLQVYDVSNPSSPTLVGSTSTGFSGSTPNDQYFNTNNAIAVSGNYIYVANYWSGQLQVYDISNPINPVLKGSVATQGDSYSISVSGNYVYVITIANNTLQIFNVSNPSDPVLTSTTGTSEYPYSVYVSGNYAYVEAIYGGGALQIFDVSNPANPILESTTDTSNSNGSSLAVSGNYLYLTGTSGTLQIFDVSNPANPVLDSTTSINSYNGASLTVSGNYLYLTGTSGTLQIFDISNPSNPVMTSVSLPSTDTGVQTIFISGNDAYVFDFSGYLYVYDISNPTSPSYLSSTPTNNGGWILGSNMATCSDVYCSTLSTNQIDMISGSSYEVIFTTTNVPAGDCLYIGDQHACGNSNQDIVFTSQSNYLSFNADENWTGNISNVQVYLINPSEATLQILDNTQNALDIRTNGYESTYVGLASGEYSYAGQNTALGTFALQSDTAGGANTAVGNAALESNTSGYLNTAVGTNSLIQNTTGSYNTSIGGGALNNNNNGSYNTALGTNALGWNESGSYDTALGYFANVSIDGLQNATAIGANAVVSESDALVLGCVSNNCSDGISTEVGIGTSSPGATLNVVSSSNNGMFVAGSGSTTTNSSGSDTPGLASSWYNSDSNDNDYMTPGNGTLAAQFVDSSGDPAFNDGSADWPNIEEYSPYGIPNGVNENYINAQWTGWLDAPSTGNYIFCTTSDDGSRIYLAGTELVNNWYNQGATQRCGSINLTANTWYPITIQYFQGSGGASIIVQWTPPSSSQSYIPSSDLSATEPNGTIFTGSFTYQNGSDVIVQNTGSSQNNLLSLVNNNGNALDSFDASGDLTIAGQAGTYNTASPASLYVGENTTTDRSINAAGSINSDGADYAEWIPWTGTGTKPSAGSIVTYDGSDYVVSSASTAAFVGNDANDTNSILVTFTGQVPVAVTGPVNAGDILVSNGDGTAIAISPSEASLSDYLSKIGVAEATSTASGVNLIESAIGTTIDNATLTSLQTSTNSFANLNISGIATITDLSVQNLTVSGNLIVTGSTSFTGNITVDGHIISGNSSGITTVAASLPNACTSTPTVSLTGNDTAGLVTITTSSSGTCAAGDLATISFASAYATSPNVVLSPDSASATTLQYYSNGVGTGSFKVSANNSPATNTTYKYYYHVIQ